MGAGDITRLGPLVLAEIAGPGTGPLPADPVSADPVPADGS
jgi:hypothetical protein